MDKFTKINKEPKKETKDKYLFELDYLKVSKKDEYIFIEESDSVCFVPIIIEDNKIMLRMEVIPPFNKVDGHEYHLTCLSGCIEEGESAIDCLKREFEEEAGMVLRDNVVVEIFDVLYKSKTGSSRFHLCILPLSLYQYDEVIAKGDGSKIEEMSNTVSVSASNIKNLKPSDTVTKLLLEEVKKYLNIQ